jgi:hypothetical protein
MEWIWMDFYQSIRGYLGLDDGGLRGFDEVAESPLEFLSSDLRKLPGTLFSNTGLQRGAACRAATPTIYLKYPIKF